MTEVSSFILKYTTGSLGVPRFSPRLFLRDWVKSCYAAAVTLSGPREAGVQVLLSQWCLNSVVQD